MTLLMMAAGRGSRYGKLKQFDDLGPNGEFLMEFSIHDALKNGFDHIVAVTQESNVDFLKEHLSERLPENIRLDVVAQKITDLPEGTTFTGERPKPWGTAHAVWTARHCITGPFVVINADDYYGQAAFAEAASYIRENKEGKDFALVAYTLKDTLSEHGSVSRGVCATGDDNQLVSVIERTKIQEEKGTIQDLDSGLEFSGNELVSMNFWICRPSIFEAIESDFREFLKGDNLEGGEIYLPFVIQEMLASGQIAVTAIPGKGQWFGVTYASDKEMAESTLSRLSNAGEYPAPLWDTLG